MDYFKEPNSPEARKMFEEMVNKLQVKGGRCRSLGSLGESQPGDVGSPEEISPSRIQGQL